MAMFAWAGAINVFHSVILSLLVFAANVITLVVCSFTNPNLVAVSRNNPTPFTPNASIMGAFVAFMYIAPFFIFCWYIVQAPAERKVCSSFLSLTSMVLKTVVKRVAQTYERRRLCTSLLNA